jgi:hypothetical protein
VTEVKASKHDSEKADLSLIPRVALEAAARAFMVGEKKYGRYNFYKGHDASQLIAALLRHATAWMEGEETDPQDGQHHLGSVIACAAMVLQQQKLGTLKDNRFKITIPVDSNIDLTNANFSCNTFTKLYIKGE